MSTLEFEPGSWDKAAEAFEEESQSFVNKAQAAIHAMDVGAMGATSSAGTVADLAFSVVFPVADDLQVTKAGNQFLIMLDSGQAHTE